MIQFDAFISHSSHDKAIADAACAQLEAAGIRCWIAPRDIVPGSDWGASILEALDRCRVMVLIFSSNANSSPQIRREVERVVNRGIPVIPVRIEDIEPTKAMAYFMGPVHWLDAMSPPLEKHLERLAESMKMLLAVESPEPARTELPGAETPSRPHAEAAARTSSVTDAASQPALRALQATSNGIAVAPGREHAFSKTQMRLLKLAMIVCISIGLLLAAGCIVYGLTVDLIVVATLTAIEFWLIYRNLTSDVRTAKIAALSCAGVLVYFILVNANSHRWDLVVIHTVSVICLGYVFVMLPWTQGDRREA